MNITRAQGSAALKRMKELAKEGKHVRLIGFPASDGVTELGWGGLGRENMFMEPRPLYLDLNEVLLALAMVVAISGVET